MSKYFIMKNEIQTMKRTPEAKNTNILNKRMLCFSHNN